MKSILICFVIPIFLFLSSCTSTNVMRLKPVEQEFMVDGGKEIVKNEHEGVKVVASYDGRYQKYMIFDVEVFNNTDLPLSVSPKNFLFTPLDANKNVLHSLDGKYAYSYVGVEPQEQMNLIKQEMDFQESKIKRARVVNTILFVGGIAALIASSGKYSESAWKTANVAETVVQVAQVKRIVDHENFYSKMNQLEHDGRVWSQENFRATTIAPGMSIRGGVFLEANARAKFVQLSYQGGKAPLNFLFEQWFEQRR
ncbi:hypothetical protein LV89_02366 [Arcicella aurantiaca]|uniref:Uncharacterized protein n=1 Tax=Arcicella aurantiaca TaxID=591202 RepID=A0A316EA34_9BACT|nr:hypothetical protein [Arcicella aurantiaca]PWK26518.1 hypothetical protein LV89_02366 [Arcicella aurantiaca]